MRTQAEKIEELLKEDRRGRRVFFGPMPRCHRIEFSRKAIEDATARDGRVMVVTTAARAEQLRKMFEDSPSEIKATPYVASDNGNTLFAYIFDKPVR